jgi:hypothetical protein
MLLAKTLIIAPVLALIALTAPAAAGSTPHGVRPANASALGTGWLHSPRLIACDPPSVGDVRIRSMR